jgi:hypothetical protein
VLGAHQAGPAPEIDCPYCATKIKANSQRCPNCGGDLAQRPAKPAGAAQAPKKLPIWAVIAGVALLLLCCGAIATAVILGSRTQDVTAQVQSVSWQRSIEILAQAPVQTGNWEAEVPAGAENLSCADRFRETRPEPAPKSTEVCGTPYTVDEGSGAGKVVQDCEYQVYDTYCEYTVLEWQVVTRAVAHGNDSQAYWPEYSLEAGQREGDRIENYLVIFERDGKIYEYSLSDSTLFARLTPGSQWTLKVNTFGRVTDVMP